MTEFAAIAARCDAIEECYEFMLGYAAQGIVDDRESRAGVQLRELLSRAVEAEGEGGHGLVGAAGRDWGSRSEACFPGGLVGDHPRHGKRLRDLGKQFFFKAESVENFPGPLPSAYVEDIGASRI